MHEDVVSILTTGTYHLVMARVVQRIGEIIVLFSDTSMKFSKQVEFSLRNIFSYRAISDFSWEKN